MEHMLLDAAPLLLSRWVETSCLTYEHHGKDKAPTIAEICNQLPTAEQLTQPFIAGETVTALTAPKEGQPLTLTASEREYQLSSRVLFPQAVMG